MLTRVNGIQEPPRTQQSMPIRQGWGAPTSKAEEEVELALRRATQLVDGQPLRPVPRPWRRLAEAMKCARSLIASGLYTQAQVGVFAKELASTGAREFYVETHAGLALTGAPRPFDPPPSQLPAEVPMQDLNLYEVILEWQPCWLYFDLEYSRSANPDTCPATVIELFYAELSTFCKSFFGAPLDMGSVLELDSTTPEKFSKHVIAKRLHGRKDQSLGDALAFRSNMQAGCVVAEFVAHLQARRHQQDSKTNGLFFKKKEEALVLPQRAVGETCLIDTSVYSRNRCFRILFSSKYGKRRPLLLMRGACLNQARPVQLLHTLVAFVPAGTELLQDCIHPVDELARAISSESKQPRPTNRNLSAWSRRDESATSNKFLQHLVESWDATRLEHETLTSMSVRRATSVQSIVRLGEADMFMVVSLAHNRFCHRKGSSHKSNGVYLVVDYCRRVFYQKCHDVDCHGFRSVEHCIPDHFFDDTSQAGRMIDAAAVRHRGDAATIDVSDPFCEPPEMDPEPAPQREKARPMLPLSQLNGAPAPGTPEKLSAPPRISSRRIATPLSSLTNLSTADPSNSFKLADLSVVGCNCCEARAAACAGSSHAASKRSRKLAALLWTVSSGESESQTEHETELDTELDSDSETQMEEASQAVLQQTEATQSPWMNWFSQFLSEDLLSPSPDTSKIDSFPCRLEQMLFQDAPGMHTSVQPD